MLCVQYGIAYTVKPGSVTGVVPPLLYQTTGREIKGTETCGCAMISLGYSLADWSTGLQCELANKKH